LTKIAMSVRFCIGINLMPRTPMIRGGLGP
jgi:hypothetical protein